MVTVKETNLNDVYKGVENTNNIGTLMGGRKYRYKSKTIKKFRKTRKTRKLRKSRKSRKRKS